MDRRVAGGEHEHEAVVFGDAAWRGAHGHRLRQFEHRTFTVKMLTSSLATLVTSRW